MGIDSQECPSCGEKFIVIHIKWVANDHPGTSYQSYHGKEKPYFVRARCCPFCGTRVMTPPEIDNGD